jgi:hypothetical protein
MVIPEVVAALATDTSRIRRVRIGGVSKSELLARLDEARVCLNPLAHALFADDRFTTAAVPSVVEVVQLAVVDLGFRQGATFVQIVEQAASAALSPCPLEVGPHLRLELTDQPEGFFGQPASQNRAPAGSITVASVPLSDRDETPKGFYLRRVKGVLWLRGYRSWHGHIWSPDDVFVFARSHDAA